MSKMTKSAQNGDQTWPETSKPDELHFDRMKAVVLSPDPKFCDREDLFPVPK